MFQARSPRLHRCIFAVIVASLFGVSIALGMGSHRAFAESSFANAGFSSPTSNFDPPTEIPSDTPIVSDTPTVTDTSTAVPSDTSTVTDTPTAVPSDTSTVTDTLD